MDNNFTTGIGHVFIWGGELPGVFAKAIENRYQNEDIKENKDNKGSFAQGLLVTQLNQVRFKFAGCVFDPDKHRDVPPVLLLKESVPVKNQASPVC